MGIPEKDGRHLILSRGIWRGRFLPGLVIDKFSDVLVVQSLALGIDRYKELIVKLLKEF